MKAARLHPPGSRTDQATAATTTTRPGNTDTPLYDGHIETRINMNRCHLNPQHSCTSFTGCSTYGMSVDCYTLMPPDFTKFVPVLNAFFLYVV